MALTDVPDDAYPLPDRRDGVDDWHRRHQRAALLRAQDWTWADIANEIGVAESTANQYTKIDGFDCLVAHLEVVVRQKRVEQSELETLEVVTEYKPKVLEALAKVAIHGDDASGSHKGAAKFLKAIGFTQKNGALAEVLAAQEGAPSEDTGDIIVDRSLDGDAS